MRLSADNVLLASWLAADTAWLAADGWTWTVLTSVVGTAGLIAWTLRRPPARRVDRSASASAIVVASYFVPLAFEIEAPASTPQLGLASGLAVLAAALWFWSILCLRESFALLPAQRAVVVAGPYRYVRHPIYASYLLGMLGAVVATPTPWNGMVLLVATLLFSIRAHREEAVLAGDDAYRDYHARVQARFVPWHREA